MKKLSLLLAALFIATMAFSQKAKVVSAFNYLKNGQLDKAKESIDPTITNEKTMMDPKTWFYRGNVYLALQLTDEAQYKGLAENPLKVAHESYLKALELDQKKEFEADIMNRLLIIGEQYYNAGVNHYNTGNYKDAASSFFNAKSINESLGRVDSLATYNYGLCSELSGDDASAAKAYQELIQMNYNNPLIYASLSKFNLQAKDTLKAIDIINAGRARFPDDFNLLIAETNLFLAKNQIEKAQANLTRAIELDKTNPTIFFAVGTTYDQMGKKDQAENAYKEAIKLDPEYFDAIYNLGALYVNQAAAIMDAANELPLGDPKYDKEKEKADNLLLSAIPYLEKAMEIDPKELNTLITLKEIYARTKMYDKMEKVNKLIQEAQGE